MEDDRLWQRSAQWREASLAPRADLGIGSASDDAAEVLGARVWPPASPVTWLMSWTVSPTSSAKASVGTEALLIHDRLLQATGKFDRS